jgi:23S rRNA (guanosine2251-2'-O)-methyltransferase
VNERELITGGLHTARATFALAPTAILELWLKRDLEAVLAAEFGALAEQHGIAVQRAEPATLDRLYGDAHHQGVVLRRRAPVAGRVKDWLATAPASPLVLALDSVQDPRNFGACLRAADGAGVDAVLYARDKSARLGAVVAKAASGALDSLVLLEAANLAQALATLSTAGLWVTGTSHDAADDLYSVDLTLPTALVLGNEGSGLRQLTRARCDRVLRIPMHGRLPSLNVASAAAVCLYEARRQRAAAVTLRGPG